VNGGSCARADFAHVAPRRIQLFVLFQVERNVLSEAEDVMITDWVEPPRNTGEASHAVLVVTTVVYNLRDIRIREIAHSSASIRQFRQLRTDPYAVKRLVPPQHRGRAAAQAVGPRILLVC
jgi:hypothetical protein